MIPYNKAHMTGQELHYLSEVLHSGKLCGDGKFTKLCSNLLEEKFNTKKVLLTSSGTSALDMCAILANIQPGDEVIMSPYTHPSTANAFMMRGAFIDFVDINMHDLNIRVNEIERHINQYTKAIVPMHYAGNSCDMDKIMTLADEYNLIVIEDAAQAINSTYKSQYLGTIGHLGIFSFHNTKNITCGEGGALLINDEQYIERAEVIRDCGTNRSQFFRSEVEAYSWNDIGSSYLMSELNAAVLYTQLEHLDSITEKRVEAYKYYYRNLLPLTDKLFNMYLPFFTHDKINGHIFYLILREKTPDDIIMRLWDAHCTATASKHFSPLHLSPMGKQLGYMKGDFPITEEMSQRIVRLPIYADITTDEQDEIIDAIYRLYYRKRQ